MGHVFADFAKIAYFVVKIACMSPLALRSLA